MNTEIEWHYQIVKSFEEHLRIIKRLCLKLLYLHRIM